METVTVPDCVVVRELDGEAILLNLETETYFGLDEVGTRVWAELAAGASIERACAVLQEEFDVEPGVLLSDVRRLVAELVETGLLVSCAGEGRNHPSRTPGTAGGPTAPMVKVSRSVR